MAHTRRRDWYRGFRRTLPYVLRFSLIWVVVCAIAVGAAAYSMYVLLGAQLPPNEHAHLGQVLVLQFGAVVAALVLLALFTTYRLAEPWLAIKRAIEEARDGKVDGKLSFRRDDAHLKELEAAFNEMLEALRKGKPEQSD